VAIRVGIACDRGAGPSQGGRKQNEDNFLVAQDATIRMRHASRTAPTGDAVLAIVSDGMGGYEGGEEASRSAVEELASLATADGVLTARALLQQVRDTHRLLHGRLSAALDGQRRMPGTTLSLLRVTGDRAAWVNVGDSRVYRLRTGRLEQLSRDHTRNEFHRRDGTAETPDGDRLCQAFILGSRGLGFDSMVRLEPGIDADTVLLRSGDVFLLSSDGVHGSLDGEAMAACLATPDPQVAADQLRDAALSAGSTDNLTAVVVRAEGLLPIAAAPLGDDGADTIQF
jgi:serine/threonine protein phosphatase PrpC